MPGSPPTSTSDPGTSPPPSTRSNSGISVESRRPGSSGTSASLSVRPGTTAAVLEDLAGPGRCDSEYCSSVFHAWHSEQRPTYAAVVQPHSLHRYPRAARAMAGSLHAGRPTSEPKLAPLDSACATGCSCSDRASVLGAAAGHFQAHGLRDRIRRQRKRLRNEHRREQGFGPSLL